MRVLVLFLYINVPFAAPRLLSISQGVRGVEGEIKGEVDNVTKSIMVLIPGKDTK